MATNERNPTLINRQIHNEDSKRITIMGQGQDAMVTVGDSGNQDPRHLDSDSSRYPPPGYSIDESIHNRNNESMTVFAQGSRAQAHISEDFAAKLMSVQKDQSQESHQFHREWEWYWKQQARALEEEWHWREQAWAREWNLQQQTLARQAWELERQAREIAHLRDIIRQHGIYISYGDDGRRNRSGHCQVQADRADEITAVAQQMPPSTTSDPIIPEQVEPKLADAISSLPEVTGPQPGQSSMASPSLALPSEHQTLPSPVVQDAVELPRSDIPVTPSHERTPTPSPAASTLNETVQPIRDTLKSMKTHLVSSFSPKGKACRKGKAA